MAWLRSLWYWCTALLIFAQSAFAHTEPVEPDEPGAERRESGESQFPLVMVGKASVGI